MKWFGKSWNAPICETAEHVEPPVGMACHLCQDKPIQVGDRGILLPFSGGPEDSQELAAHLRCFILSLSSKGKEEVDAWIATLP